MPFIRFLPALFLALSASFLPAQEPPRVVSTIPANGASAVSTKVGRILMVFDKDMLQGAFSLVKAGSGVVPPIQGRPRYLDARTFSIPLGPLKPGTTYSIGFNNARRKGFQSADNIPLAPYVLTFTTAGGKAAPPPGRPDESSLPRGPMVVRTSPPSGKASVDPSLDKIEIWFSHDMNPRGMSLTRIPGKTRLGYIPGKPPFFAGPRRLVIPVKLSPGTDYGVGINTGPRKGFVTAREGLPVRPYRLVFSTAGGASSPKRLTPPAGRWVRGTSSERIEHWFFPDGAWGLLRVNGKRRTFIHGKWSATGKTLTLSNERGKTLPPLLWEVEKDGSLVLRRNAADKRPSRLSPLPLPGKKDLTGRWRTRWGGNNRRTWTFGKDGSFSCLTLVLGQRIDRSGTWETRGLKLIVRGRADTDPEIYGWTMEPSGKLALTMETGVTQFYDKLSAAPSPRAPLPPGGIARPEVTRPTSPHPKADPLVGRWVASEEGMRVEIVFQPGGRYMRKLATPDGTETSQGTWLNKGSYLVVRDEEDGEIMKIGYKFLGADRLELHIEGEVVRLTRTGKGIPSPQPLPRPGQGARPPALFGTWAAQDMTGAIALTLAGNGAFRLYLRQGMKETVLEGTWTVSGGGIDLAIRKPNQGRYRIPYEGPVGSDLTVTMNNTKLILKKQPK